MDSKSISRKGVGVRLPSLAPASDAALAEAAHVLGQVLVPHLCRRLRAATDELGALERRLAHDPRRTLSDESLARRHEELGLELARAGYCLGVLGAGGRADLLRERRERRGLRWFAAECCTAFGAVLSPGEAELPALEGPGSAGWRTALRAGWGIAEAARGGTTLHWSTGADALVLSLARPLRPAARGQAQALGLRLEPGALVVGLS